MPEKRDVREEMIKAADFVSAMNLVSGLSGEGTRPELDLASRVLKHEAGVDAVAKICTRCKTIKTGQHGCCGVKGLDGYGRPTGPICGGTLIELIPRYRGDDDEHSGT